MAPETTARLPLLEAGARFRLGRSGRRGVFEFGLGRDGLGSVKVLPKGDVLVTLDGAEYTVHAPRKAWDLVLRSADGTEVGLYAEGRRRTGTLTVGDATLKLTAPRRRKATGELATTDGTPVAEIRIQGGVLLLEVFRPLHTLAAAFATVVLALRLGYRRPNPGPAPLWEPGKAAWWGTAIAGGWSVGAGAGWGYDGGGFGDGGGGDGGGGGC